MKENEEELKSLLMKVKEKNEKAVLKLNIQKTKIMASSPTTSWQIGKMWKQCQMSFSWAPKSMQTVTAATKLRGLLLGKIAMSNLDSKQRCHFANKSPYSESYGFSSSHV